MGKIKKSYRFNKEVIDNMRNKLEVINSAKVEKDENDISETSFLEMLINDFDVEKYLNPDSKQTGVEESEEYHENTTPLDFGELEAKVDKILELMEKANFEEMLKSLKRVSFDINLNTDWIKMDLATHIDLHKIETNPNLRRRMVMDLLDYPRLRGIIVRDIEEEKKRIKGQ